MTKFRISNVMIITRHISISVADISVASGYGRPPNNFRKFHLKKWKHKVTFTWKYCVQIAMQSIAPNA